MLAIEQDEVIEEQVFAETETHLIEELPEQPSLKLEGTTKQDMPSKESPAPRNISKPEEPGSRKEKQEEEEEIAEKQEEEEAQSKQLPKPERKIKTKEEL